MSERMTLRCTVGVYCSLAGALMLVAPHRIAGLPDVLADTGLTFWGVVFLAAGIVQLASIALPVRPPVLMLAHLASAGLLLAMAASLALDGRWAGATMCASLTLALALTQIGAAHGAHAGPRTHRALLLLMAVCAVLHGVSILGWPSITVPDVQNRWHPGLLAVGLGYSIGGALLACVQLRGRSRLAGRRGAHARRRCAAGERRLPEQSSAPGPWLPVRRGWLAGLAAAAPARTTGRFDGTSLRARVAVVLAITVAVPLIAVVSLVSERQERTATEHELQTQRTVAHSIARDVATVREARPISRSATCPQQTGCRPRHCPGARRGVGRQRVYVVDAAGRAIAQGDGSRVPPLTDRSARPPVATLLAASDTTGAQVYVMGRSAWIAGYATVPGTDWGVVVEQPLEWRSPPRTAAETSPSSCFSAPCSWLRWLVPSPPIA